MKFVLKTASDTQSRRDKNDSLLVGLPIWQDDYRLVTGKMKIMMQSVRESAIGV
jgi:hypothetical protein